MQSAPKLCVRARRASVIPEAMCFALSLHAGSCLSVSWSLEAGDFTRRRVRAQQVWPQLHAQAPTIGCVFTCTQRNGHKKHTSEPRANVYNYPPDTASQSAFSCWLTPDQLACLCAHAQIKHIYMQHTFTIQYVRNYTNSHLLLRSYEHMRVRTHKYRDK